MTEPGTKVDAMEERFPIALSEDVRRAVSFESYPAAAEIDGAWVRPLRKHRSENGAFLEVLRVSGGAVEGAPGAGLELRQLSVSRADPHRLNAFHLHPRAAQNELWTVLQGQLLVWLVDCRRDSPTEGARRRALLSGEEPVLLHIPAGVAHGYRAGAEGALLLYAMDQQFDPAAPNEGRLPWDFFGAGLWAEDRG